MLTFRFLLLVCMVPLSVLCPPQLLAGTEITLESYFRDLKSVLAISLGEHKTQSRIMQTNNGNRNVNMWHLYSFLMALSGKKGSIYSHTNLQAWATQ